MSVKSDLSNLRMEYQAAVARNSGISVAKNRLMNFMFSNIGDIEQAMAAEHECQKKLDAMQQELDALNAALAEADEENDSLREQLKKKAPAKG